MSTQYKCELDDGGAKRAKNELGEIETDREAAVQALREWVLAQGDWLKSPTETQFLLGFLRHRKFSQKAAKERLIQYWKIRTDIPEWFSKVDTTGPKLSKGLRSGMFMPLPKRDKDGSLVIMIRPQLLDMKGGTSAINDQFTSCGALFDLVLRQDMTQVCGVKIFVDFSGVTAEHVLKLAEGAFKKVTQSYMRSYPLRICAQEYYNIGTVFELFFSISRPMTPKKINDRTKTHKTMKSVYNSIDMSVFPREYLPDDYTGAHAGTVQEILDKFIADVEETSSRDYISRLSSGEFYCDDKMKPDDVIPTESFRSLQL